MWSSDYPHSASTWPDSLKLIDRDFGLEKSEEKVKIVRDNVSKLYGFNL